MCCYYTGQAPVHFLSESTILRYVSSLYGIQQSISTIVFKSYINNKTILIAQVSSKQNKTKQTNKQTIKNKNETKTNKKQKQTNKQTNKQIPSQFPSNWYFAHSITLRWTCKTSHYQKGRCRLEIWPNLNTTSSQKKTYFAISEDSWKR